MLDCFSAASFVAQRQTNRYELDGGYDGETYTLAGCPCEFQLRLRLRSTVSFYLFVPIDVYSYQTPIQYQLYVLVRLLTDR